MVGTKWNFDIIRDLFGDIQSRNISQIYIPMKDMDDKWIWALNAKGKLCCKIAYNFMKSKLCSKDIPALNRANMWNSDTLPKIKIFAWKLLWKRLPTTSAGIHSLLCRVLAEVQVNSTPYVIKNSVREAEKENNSSILHLVGNFVMQHGDFFNIFCDAAWLPDNYEAGMGFLISDSEDRILFADSFSKFVDSPLYAEIWSIWLAVNKAKDLSLKNIRLHFDCQTAINFLNCKCKPPWSLKVLVADILKVASVVNVTNWTHINRSANAYAHNLAKAGLSFHGEVAVNCLQVSKRQAEPFNVSLLSASVTPLQRQGVQSQSDAVYSSHKGNRVDASEIFHESVPPDSPSLEAHGSYLCVSPVNSVNATLDSHVKTFDSSFFNKVIPHKEDTSVHVAGEGCTARVLCSLSSASVQ
ncbi:reverse transcriptase [Canna indica]|uniref:Reverse transcriptase n=1 Tax=Canna indica TaxID=4628 RepID=A0AAQ3QL33_9LILI|nr:reverse transcriptase [Canna indica]